MADLSRIVEVIFQGNDQLSQTMRGIGEAADKMNVGIESIAAPLASVADGVLAADAALLGLAVGGLAYAISKSIEYEEAVNDLKKVLGDTESVETATNKTQELADTYGSSSIDVLSAITAFKQAGYTLEESGSLAETALQGMIAGGVDASESIEILVKSLAGLGLETDQARKVLETSNMASNQFGVSFSQMSDAVSRAAPLIKTYGFDLNEAAGILAVMTEANQDAEKSATSFRSGLANLTSETGNAKAGFQELGFTTEEIANRSFASTSEILAQMVPLWDDLDANQKRSVSTSIFGKEHFSNFIQVLDNYGKVTEFTAQSNEDLAKSFEQELEVRLQSTQIQLDRFSNAFTDLTRTIGDEFKASAAGVVSGGTEIEIALRKIVESGTFKPIIDAVISFADKFEDLLKDVAKNLPEAFADVEFAGLIESFGVIESSVLDFFDDFDISTPEGLTKVLQLVVDTLTNLGNVTSGMLKQFKPFFQAIVEAIRQVGDLDVESQKAFGNILGSAKIVMAAGKEVAYAFFVIQQSGIEIENVFNVIAGGAKLFVNLLQVAFDGLAMIVLNTIQTLVDAAYGIVYILPGFEEMEEKLKGVSNEIDEYRKIIQEDQGKQFSEAVEGMNQALDGFTGTTRDAKTAAKDFKKEVDAVPKDIDIVAKLEQEGITVDEFQRGITDGDFGITVTADTTAIETVGQEIKEKIPTEKNILITVESDEAFGGKLNEQAMRVAGDIGGILIDGVKSFSNVDFGFSEKSVKEAKEDIESVSPDKKYELDLKFDMAQIEADTAKVTAQIEADAKIMSDYLKFSAEIDIAKLEADAKKIEAIAGTIQSGFDSAASVIGDALGGYTDAGRWEQLYLESIVRDQLDLQKKQLEQQDKLLEQQDKQISLEQQKLDLKKIMLEQGGGLMTFQLDPGINPALEEVLRKMVEYVQVWATDEGLEALIQA